MKSYNEALKILKKSNIKISYVKYIIYINEII